MLKKPSHLLPMSDIKLRPTSTGLDRFLTAQDNKVAGTRPPQSAYDQALKELQQGKKASHWIWYIFPQHVGINPERQSQKSKIYGLAGVDEAKRYLAHETLGKRLRECVWQMLDVTTNFSLTPEDILGSDHLKFHSCISIFVMASDAVGSGDDIDNIVFHEALATYWQGEFDEATLNAIAREK
jgi:uncharacterized protein (DUF1810 family)